MAATRRTNRRKKNARWNAAVVDTVKIIAFSQLVLLFAAGAIPEPYKVFALAPLGTLLGAAAFWAVNESVLFFRNRATLQETAAQNAAATPATPRPRAGKVVKINKIA